jgi:hypothetical protein
VITARLNERDVTTIFDDAVQYADTRTDLDPGMAILAYLRQELGEGITLVIPPDVWPIGRPERIPHLYAWLMDWIRTNR